MPSIRIFMRDRWTSSSPHSSAALFWVRLFFCCSVSPPVMSHCGGFISSAAQCSMCPSTRKTINPSVTQYPWKLESDPPPTPPFSSLCEFVSPPSWRHRPHSNLSCQQRTSWQAGRHKRSWSYFYKWDSTQVPAYSSNPACCHCTKTFHSDLAACCNWNGN